MKRIDPPDLTFAVETYLGYKGEETPKSFIVRGRTYHITEIIDQWYGKSHSFFRVLANDGYRYVLRHEFEHGIWELVMQEAKRQEQIDPEK